MVEMALMTPFLLVLSAGVFEFSKVLETRLLIESGVADAARYAARCSDDQTTCDSRAKNLATTGEVSGGNTRVAGWNSSAVTIVYNATPAVADDGTLNYRSNTTDVLVVHVSTTYDYTGTGLWSVLGLGSLTLAADHEERVIGW